MAEIRPIDLVFTEAVKAAQTANGAREICDRPGMSRAFKADITPDLAAFVAERDSFYFGTASADGRPYIQHRGGTPGFLKVIDEHTLAFADYPGNKHYVTVGNLSENDRAFIFLMDYTNRRRIKVWGRARTVDDNPGLLEKLKSDDVPIPPERAVVFVVDAWNVNCQQYIRRRYAEEDVKRVVDALTRRIAELETEVETLRRASADVAAPPPA